MAQNLNLPEYQLNIKKINNAFVVFDALRRRFVALTPEEWVRQNFVQYLIHDRQYPAALMGNEISLVQNGIQRRCDTLVADRHGAPLVIVEYKAPTVRISQATFDQIVRYNMVLQARYLVVSNGMEHFCCQLDYDNDTYHFLNEIPPYPQLLQ